MDDWEMAPLILKANTGELTWPDLLTQQQEARPILPRIIFILSAMGRPWNVREQIFLSIALCCLTAGGLYLLLRKSGLSPWVIALCFWLSVLLIFSPAQFELWHLASGFPSYLVAFFLVAALVGLESKISMSAKFLVSALCATAASFTLSHGLLLWGLTFPLLFLAQKVRHYGRWLSAWVVWTVACAAIYSLRYLKPDYLPPFAPSSVPVVDYLHFVLIFLGGSFGYALPHRPATIAGAVGAVLLALFLAELAYSAIRIRDAEFRRRVLPWFALGFYSIGSAFLASLGRSALGAEYALASRYVPFSLYLTVAVITLWAILCGEFVRSHRPLLLRCTAVAFGFALGVAGTFLYRRAAQTTLDFMRADAAQDRLGRGAVLFSATLDTSRVIDRIIYPPGGEVVRQRALALDKLKLLRPGLVHTKQIRLLAGEGAHGEKSSGVFESLVSAGSDAYRASGWAVLPANRRVCNGVILSYQTTANDWVAFGISDSVEPRREVVRRLHDWDFYWSGWSATFPRTAVPPGAKITAWAIDADVPKLYQLEGEFSLEAVPR